MSLSVGRNRSRDKGVFPKSISMVKTVVCSILAGVYLVASVALGIGVVIVQKKPKPPINYDKEIRDQHALLEEVDTQIKKLKRLHPVQRRSSADLKKDWGTFNVQKALEIRWRRYFKTLGPERDRIVRKIEQLEDLKAQKAGEFVEMPIEKDMSPPKKAAVQPLPVPRQPTKPESSFWSTILNEALEKFTGVFGKSGKKSSEECLDCGFGIRGDKPPKSNPADKITEKQEDVSEAYCGLVDVSRPVIG